ADISAPPAVRQVFARILPTLADGILVNGHATLRAHPWLPPISDRLTIYYPVVDEDKFKDRSARLRGASVVVGMIANINPDKGIDVFVEAAALIDPMGSLQFVLVGAEHDTHRAYARRIHARVEELGLGDRF